VTSEQVSESGRIKRRIIRIKRTDKLKYDIAYAKRFVESPEYLYKRMRNWREQERSEKTRLAVVEYMRKQADKS